MRVVYPGSFDPATNGHLDVIQRASISFTEVIVAVAHQSGKSPLFSVEERVGMLGELLEGMDNVSVDQFQGLAVNYVREKKGDAILRGIRTMTDFEYEFQMAQTNREFAPDLETLFVMTAPEFSYVSSRLIKEAVSLGGDVRSFVPPLVVNRLRERYPEFDAALREAEDAGNA